MRNSQRAFSLIELLIVVAIILIIAAIAIPDLMRSRMAANQSSAVASCRMINTAEVTYAANYGAGFTSTLLQLGPPASGPVSESAAGLIDSVLATGVKSGYSFTYVPTSPDARGFYNGYNVSTGPTRVGVTGTTYYFTDQTYVIRANPSGPASAADSPVAN